MGRIFRKSVSSWWPLMVGLSTLLLGTSKIVTGQVIVPGNPSYITQDVQFPEAALDSYTSITYNDTVSVVDTTVPEKNMKSSRVNAEKGLEDQQHSDSPPDGLQQEASPLYPRNFTHRAVMDQMGNYIMLWSPLQDKIIIEIQVATLGYVGFGFSPNGGMKGADIIIAWVDDSNRIYFQDRHATSQQMPIIDEFQNYQLLGGFQNNTHTVVRFARLWTTCDGQHDYQLTGDTQRVIWAYSNEDPINAKNVPFHQHRGTRSLYLREPQLHQISWSSDVQFWDILSPGVRVPDNLQTLYWCKLYKIPDLSKKAHFIGFTPIIQPGNEAHVHHMLLYECHLLNSHEHFGKFEEAPGAQCYTRNMPFSWSACNTPIVAWAIGSEGEVFPEHVGVPLGEVNGGATYFMLEIHYDNPNLKKGLIDHSGVRIHYTHNLRQYDAGILTLGHVVSPTQIIPPEQDWETIAHCTEACTSETIPASGIKVFHGFLHAHVLGSSISVQQIRRGQEIPVVLKDLNYDFNYQQVRVLKEEMEVLPGDSFIIKCGYNSTKRKWPSFGGFSTEDEMCLAFLTYYPRVNLSSCSSKPDMALVFDTFGIQDLFNNDMTIFNDRPFDENYIIEEEENVNLKSMIDQENTNHEDIHLDSIYDYIVIKSPKRYYNMSFRDILYDEKTWQDTNMVASLQERIKYGQYEPTCEYHGRLIVEGLPKKAKYPDFIPLKPVKQEKCTESFSNIIVEAPEFIESKEGDKILTELQPQYPISYIPVSTSNGKSRQHKDKISTETLASSSVVSASLSNNSQSNNIHLIRRPLSVLLIVFWFLLYNI